MRPRSSSTISRPDRRIFMRDGVVLIAAGSVVAAPALALDDSTKPAARFGLVTDLHHADKPPRGTRHYRQSRKKFAEAATAFRDANVDFVVELGDLIDAADSVDVELGYLKTIDREFSAVCDDRHYVIGNHCVDTLTKEEFLGNVGQPSSYYGFDRGGFHFVVLDSCFRGDGQPYGRKNFTWTDANVPPAELEWLRGDLRATDKPVVVFAHQRLDVSNNHGVKNNADVRRVLEESGKVLAVFQGHSHQNDLNRIGGIPYCTLVAMVEGSGKENSGYATVDLHPDGTLALRGFRRQSDRRWDASETKTN